MKPFFSIIIPTYNQGYLLKKCLHSVFSQTFKSFEVIVVDNFSTDITKKIISKYNDKIIYKKIKNKGVIAKSRNLGLKLSNGEWIAFLDSDDIWKNDKLEKMFYLINRKNFEVVCNSEWFLYNDRISLNVPGPFEKNFYSQLLLMGNRLSTSASIVKKSFVRKNKIIFPESSKFISCEDYYFFLEIARKQGKFYFYKHPLGYHLFHKKSVSSDTASHSRAGLEVLKHHIFKLQKFSKQKKKMYSLAIEYRDIRKNIIFLSKRIYFPNNLFKLLLIFFSKPIKFINLTRYLFKNKFDSYFYRNF